MKKLYHNGFDVSAALQQSGSFAYIPFSEPFEAEVLVVGGGGGGGHHSFGEAAGGGAGGLFSGSVTIGTGETNIIVGTGGDGGNNSVGQEASGSIITGSMTSLVAQGGGGGGSSAGSSARDGVDGGSGGGGAFLSPNTGSFGEGLQPLSGSGHFGNDGGTGLQAGGAAGGGGAGTAGQDYDGVNIGGGGLGKTININGTSTLYAVGGDSNTAGNSTNPARGSGGFGSDRNPANNNNKGRDGIVIIRYEGPEVRARGGVLTKVGNDYVHTFTSTGVLYN